MSFLFLVLAGLLEVVWAVGLRLSEGFSKPVPSLVTVVALVASLWLLSLSLRSFPLGSAYAIWVGIGAAGTALVGMIHFGEPVTTARVGFLVLLVVAVVGLELTTPAHTG